MMKCKNSKYLMAENESFEKRLYVEINSVFTPPDFWENGLSTFVPQ